MVETALSREKKNEEISDGDKESALVNIDLGARFWPVNGLGARFWQVNEFSPFGLCIKLKPGAKAFQIAMCTD